MYISLLNISSCNFILFLESRCVLLPTWLSSFIIDFLFFFVERKTLWCFQLSVGVRNWEREREIRIIEGPLYYGPLRPIRRVKISLFITDTLSRANETHKWNKWAAIDEERRRKTKIYTRKCFSFTERQYVILLNVVDIVSKDEKKKNIFFSLVCVFFICACVGYRIYMISTLRQWCTQ